MAIHGLFIGCNYSGESCELPDCEQDAESIAAALEPYLQTGVCLLGEKAERRPLLKALANLKTKLKKTDLAIVSFSGHGTTDNIDDKPAQGIVTNDMEVIYEFELRSLLTDLGQAVLIADSCFAGGLLRGAKRHRWVPISHCFRRDVTPPKRLPAKPHATYLACKANETAASTGKGGALTLALLEAFAERKDKTTFAGLAAALKKLLPNKDYPQHPQFRCANKTFANRTLKSFNKKWNKP